MRWFKRNDVDDDKNSPKTGENPAVSGNDETNVLKPVDANGVTGNHEDPASVVDHGDRGDDPSGNEANNDGVEYVPHGEYGATSQPVDNPTGPASGDGDADEKSVDDKTATDKNAPGVDATAGKETDRAKSPASSTETPAGYANAAAIAQAAEQAKSLRNGALAFLLFAVVVFGASVNFAYISSSDGQIATAQDNLQTDVTTITDAISKKAQEHQDKAEELLAKYEAPGDVQLKMLGGWRLTWRQYEKDGKQYGEVKNMEGANGDVQTVWTGELKSAKDVKFTVTTSVDNARDGKPTDNLTTYAYAVTGRIPPTDAQLKAAKTDSERNLVESSAKSIVMFADGDSEAKAAMLKTQGDAQYSRSTSADASKESTDSNGSDGTKTLPPDSAR